MTLITVKDLLSISFERLLENYCSMDRLAVLYKIECILYNAFNY